jgi:serine protease Do
MMQGSKAPALLAAFAIAIAGSVVTAVVHGQSRDRAPVVRAFEFVGRGTQIGVTVKDMESDDSKGPSNGVTIEEVQEDSPAEKAGFKTGDTILEFDGERVRSVRQFSRLVQETPAGRKVQAVVSRSGQRVTISVVPEGSAGMLSGDDFGLDRWEDGVRSWAYGAPPAPPAPPGPAAPIPPRAPRPPAFAMPDIPDFNFGRLGQGGRVGLSVESLTPQLEEYFGVKDGVLVRSVTDGSAAAKAGVRAGDVLTAVNGSRVSDASDVARALNRIDDGDEFSLEIVREKKTQTLKGKMERHQARARSRTTV